MSHQKHDETKDESHGVAKVAFIITLVSAILFIGSAYYFVIGPA
jgi:hypothetical protein